ncbi:hypothetical protein ACSS6W_002649 [Trichoderma asperelloides]
MEQIWSSWPCGTGMELGRFELMLVSSCSPETRVMCVPTPNQGLDLTTQCIAAKSYSVELLIKVLLWLVVEVLLYQLT